MNGKQQGNGELFAPNKRILYSGEWQEDMCHGTGTHYPTPDTQYNGQFKNNKYFGEGVLIKEDQIYKGFFYNGKKVGKFMIENPSCINMEVEYKNEGNGRESYLHGSCILHYPGGRIVKGEF